MPFEEPDRGRTFSDETPWDSETWERAAENVARTLASFRLGLDAEDPFKFNEAEKLQAGHIVGHLSSAGLLNDRIWEPVKQNKNKLSHAGQWRERR